MRQILFLLLVSANWLCGQNVSVEKELEMNFPGIYFKHNSTDYAAMPYTADSCLNYILLHIKDINDLVMWRDTLETNKLTTHRIKKIKNELRKHKLTRNIHIESMGTQQKVSRRTIEMNNDSAQINYLLSLNSVFDVSGIINRK
jgi:hypothetical protein